MGEEPNLSREQYIHSSKFCTQLEISPTQKTVVHRYSERNKYCNVSVLVIVCVNAFLNYRLTHILGYFCLTQWQNTGGACNVNESGPRSYSSHSAVLSKLPRMI